MLFANELSHINLKYLFPWMQYSPYGRIVPLCIPLCYIHPEGLDTDLQLALRPHVEQGKQQFSAEYVDKTEKHSKVSALIL